MRTHLPLAALLLCLLPVPSAVAAPATLPLKRIRIYETGVGYFERGGRLDKDGRIGLRLPAGHLDDALKTLVLMSKDGKASVRAVAFSSRVSRMMARKRAALRVDRVDGESTPKNGMDYEQLLASMKGVRVVVRNKDGAHTGKVVDVITGAPHETCALVPTKGAQSKTRCVTKAEPVIVLVTDKGQLMRIDTTDVSHVKPTDPAWRSRIASVIDATLPGGAESKLRVAGTARQPITMGYIAETPVWRTSYRLVLDDSGAGADRLQGWTLLHNDTAEDWKNLTVELVNGRPDSFMFPLAAPRYERRQLLTPDRKLPTVPQLLGKTVDNMWAFGESDSAGDGVGGFSRSGIGAGGGGRGAAGVGFGRIGTIGVGVGSGSLLNVGNLAGLATTDGAESGVLFLYRLGKAIDLKAQGSASVPFLNEAIKVTSMTYFSRPDEPGRASVHLTNNTRQTFPGGPMAIFADGGFAGEALLARTKPREHRLLTFGADLDLELTGQNNDDGAADYTETLKITYWQGMLVEHYLSHSTRTYELDNRSSRPRKAYLRLSYVNNAVVTGADGLTYDSEANKAVAIFSVPAHKVKRYVLKAREGMSRQHAFNRLGPVDLRLMASHTRLPVTQRGILRKAASYVEAAAKAKRLSVDRGRALRQAKRDIKRLRASIKVMPDDENLRARLLGKEAHISKFQRARARLERHAKRMDVRAREQLTFLNEK